LEASLPQGSASGKTHYNFSKPDLHNKRASQYVDWEEDGSYWEQVFDIIPLDKVHYEKWNQSRYDDLLPKMKAGKPIDPVYLCKSSDGTYSVGDGNHRCAVSAALGYTHVPAIVSVQSTQEPTDTTTSAVNEEKSGRELFMFIESLRAKNVTGVFFHWDAAFQWDYSVNVENDNLRFIAVIRVNRRETERVVYVEAQGHVVARETFSGFKPNAMAHWVVPVVMRLVR
jgi:hypothetical protein